MPSTPHGCPSPDERIEKIKELMLLGRWQRGVTSVALAHEWGLTKGTVENDSAEAWRIIKRERASTPETREDDRMRMHMALERGIDIATKKEDPKAIASVVKVWAELTGELAPQKVEQTTTVTSTPADAKRIMGELFPGAVGPKADAPDEGKPSE